MSTRWYPLYQKGNPQLRVFLPNFWMKLVRPMVPVERPNQVQFVVSTEMSAGDVKTYLEKIYNVPVVHVRTYIQQGQFKRAPVKGYIVKEDDFKVAFVTLPKDMKFTFPEVCSKEKMEKELDGEKKNLEQLRENYKKYLKRNQYRPDLPGWFL